MIGRKKESAELKERYESGRAELVVVHGRWLVGKTYLIDPRIASFYTRLANQKG